MAAAAAALRSELPVATAGTAAGWSRFADGRRLVALLAVHHTLHQVTGDHTHLTSARAIVTGWSRLADGRRLVVLLAVHHTLQPSYIC